MYKLILVVTFIFVFLNLISQSEFAPEEAVWYYSVPEGMHPPNVGYLKISVSGETILDGKTARILNKTHFCATGDTINWGSEYIYQEADTVFYWEKNNFHVLYIFSQIPDNSWLVRSSDFFYCDYDSTGIIKTDSVGNIIINSNTLQYFYSSPDDTSKWEFKGITIEKIGNLEYLLPKPVDCGITDILEEVPGPLRCYYDNELGLYKAQSIPCDTIISFALRIKNSYSIRSKYIHIYPNPAHSQIFIESEKKQTLIDRIVLYDLYGNIKISRKVNSSKSEISIYNINPGFYFIHIIFPDNSKSIYKLIKRQ